MTHWLHERYISRAEHQEIVAYYKRLVVQLYGNVRTLRAQADGMADTDDLQQAKTQTQPAAKPSPGGANVVHVEFRRQS